MANIYCTFQKNTVLRYMFFCTVSWHNLLKCSLIASLYRKDITHHVCYMMRLKSYQHGFSLTVSRWPINQEVAGTSHNTNKRCTTVNKKQIKEQSFLLNLYHTHRPLNVDSKCISLELKLVRSEFLLRAINLS